MNDTSDIYAALAEISLAGSTRFAESVLALLVERFDLLGASLLLYADDAAALRLRAQVGLDATLYESFEVPMNTVAGRAVVGRQPVASSEIVGAPEFRDQELLAALGATAVACVPLLLGEDGAGLPGGFAEGDPIGVVCLYPKAPEVVDFVCELVSEFSPFIARLYLASLERAAMDLRNLVVERVAFRRDIGSLTHAFLSIVSDWISSERAAIWVFDPRYRQLYERMTADLGHVSKPAKQKALPIANSGSRVVNCFERRETIAMNARPARELRVKSNWTAIPVLLPDDVRLVGEATGCAGVVTLSDHYTTIGGAKHLTTLDWEERYVAEFACELLSVLLYQVLRGKDLEGDFERLMHGAQMNLQAARNNLQLFEKEKASPRGAHFGDHLLPNAIDWIQDLEMQLVRDSLVAQRTLDVESIALYGDVLAKLGPMVDRLNRRFKRSKLELVGFDELAKNYRILPHVKGNRQALDCVFRNLVDNARKYCTPRDGGPSRVYIECDQVGSDVFVRISDNGEGIPKSERQLVFEDGYRGQLAWGRSTQGVGRGLFDCKRLVDLMDGEITAGPGPYGGAQFEIRLKVQRAPRRHRYERGRR